MLIAVKLVGFAQVLFYGQEKTTSFFYIISVGISACRLWFAIQIDALGELLLHCQSSKAAKMDLFIIYTQSGIYFFASYRNKIYVSVLRDQQYFNKLYRQKTLNLKEELKIYFPDGATNSTYILHKSLPQSSLSGGMKGTKRLKLHVQLSYKNLDLFLFGELICRRWHVSGKIRDYCNLPLSVTGFIVIYSHRLYLVFPVLGQVSRSCFRGTLPPNVEQVITLSRKMRYELE